LFALAPAIKAAGIDAGELKRRGIGTHAGTAFLRNVLISAQIAFSLIALISAGLFLRSLQQAVRIDPGFALDELAMMESILPLKVITKERDVLSSEMCWDVQPGLKG